jgi:hypothetical protein
MDLHYKCRKFYLIHWLCKNSKNIFMLNLSTTFIS